jgi:glycosyltransferase involved in cell wall biosynthesis
MIRIPTPDPVPVPATGYTASTPLDSAPIIAHCHLRWDFVWQRPQQIFSRLATHHPVLFIEDPVEGEGHVRLELTEVLPAIVRAVPVVPGCSSMSIDQQCAAVLPVLHRSLAKDPMLAEKFDRPIHWFYSPMTAPAYVGQFHEVRTVYDCMDELSNFRFAPSDLSQRESFLLSQADVVFTGGYKLFEAKSQLHRNTHFYGCGVDLEHFGKARLPETACPPDMALLDAPILGYFGVIDERLDYSLIAKLAAAFPEGSVVMVGPLAKVEHDALPKAHNIHWMGQRAYRDLPAIVKTFDVCLMPFAMNESTRYINPTKTLEYMAAGKPIVSTAVPDVVRHFTPVVQVASGSEEFVALARQASSEPDAALIHQGIARAAAASWDAIVSNMRADMCSAKARSDASAGTACSPSAAACAHARQQVLLPGASAATHGIPAATAAEGSHP